MIHSFIQNSVNRGKRKDLLPQHTSLPLLPALYGFFPLIYYFYRILRCRCQLHKNTRFTNTINIISIIPCVFFRSFSCNCSSVKACSWFLFAVGWTWTVDIPVMLQSGGNGRRWTRSTEQHWKIKNECEVYLCGACAVSMLVGWTVDVDSNFGLHVDVHTLSGLTCVSLQCTNSRK